MFHLVSLSLQISLTDLPGPCLGLCVGVACFCCFWVGLLLVSFFWGNLISITCLFQLLTDHVSHLSGNAGKKKPLSPHCRWTEKDFVACLPPLWLKRQVSWVAKSRSLSSSARVSQVTYKTVVVCGTLSWSHSMGTS